MKLASDYAEVKCSHGARWRWWPGLQRWEQVAHIKGCDHQAPSWSPDRTLSVPPEGKPSD